MSESLVAPPMPLTCDLCGDPIWPDETPQPVTAQIEDTDTGGTAEGLLACPTCVETGPSVWIYHRRWHTLRSAIIPEWAL